MESNILDLVKQIKGKVLRAITLAESEGHSEDLNSILQTTNKLIDIIETKESAWSSSSSIPIASEIILSEPKDCMLGVPDALMDGVSKGIEPVLTEYNKNNKWNVSEEETADVFLDEATSEDSTVTRTLKVESTNPLVISDVLIFRNVELNIGGWEFHKDGTVEAKDSGKIFNRNTEVLPDAILFEIVRLLIKYSVNDNKINMDISNDDTFIGDLEFDEYEAEVLIKVIEDIFSITLDREYIENNDTSLRVSDAVEIIKNLTSERINK